MSATTTHTSHPTNEADVPSAPPEAHQKAYAGEVGCAEDNARTVVLNGPRIRMMHDGKQRSNVSVTAI